MSRADTEHRIAANRQAVDALTAAMVDLDSNGIYAELLAGGFTGETSRRWVAVAADAPVVWAWLGAVSSTIDQAANEMNAVGRVFDSSERASVQRLLTGRVVSIDLPGAQHGAGTSMTSVPDPPLHTLGELMAASERVVVAGTALVAEIERRRSEHSPVVAELDATLDRARTQLPSGELDPSELTEATAAVTAHRAKLATDPLAGGLDAGPVVKLVEQALGAVSDIGEHHGATSAELATAERTLGTIARVRSLAEIDGAAARAVVGNSGGVRAVPSADALHQQPDGLAPLLDRIRLAADRAGGWRGARVALERWQARADATLAQLERIAKVNQGLAVRHAELNGLMSAYEAKAEALGRRDDVGVSTSLTSARRMLKSRPVDLDGVTALLTDLARKLE